MSVHIPEGWNPHSELLAIADYARDCAQRVDRLLDKAEEAEDAQHYREAEDLRQRAAAAITRGQMREVNFRVCLLAMRLSACRITIPAAEAEQEGGAL